LTSHWQFSNVFVHLISLQNRRAWQNIDTVSKRTKMGAKCSYEDGTGPNAKVLTQKEVQKMRQNMESELGEKMRMREKLRKKKRESERKALADFTKWLDTNTVQKVHKLKVDPDEAMNNFAERNGCKPTPAMKALRKFSTKFDDLHSQFSMFKDTYAKEMKVFKYDKNIKKKKPKILHFVFDHGKAFIDWIPDYVDRIGITTEQNVKRIAVSGIKKDKREVVKVCPLIKKLKGDDAKRFFAVFSPACEPKVFIAMSEKDRDELIESFGALNHYSRSSDLSIADTDTEDDWSESESSSAIVREKKTKKRKKVWKAPKHMRNKGRHKYPRKRTISGATI